MSHDSASGVISFENKTDDIDITWEKVGFEKSFTNVNQALEKIARGLGGTFVRNPTWLESLGRSVVSAHPLGGCPMGESGRTAVVNHAGQVFDGKLLSFLYQRYCCSLTTLTEVKNQDSDHFCILFVAFFLSLLAQCYFFSQSRDLNALDSGLIYKSFLFAVCF